MEVILPTMPYSYTIASYELIHCRPTLFKFISVKFVMRKELICLKQEKKRKKKVSKRQKKVMRLMSETSEMEIEEESILGNITFYDKIGGFQ